MSNDYEISAPKPCSLIESLRSVGYSLSTAIADILDNSITAGAKNIWIDFHWNGPRSHVSILDDGRGMSESVLADAMRPGSANPLDNRRADDLGRYGLGLKTASFSQCRKLSVWSQQPNEDLSGRCWDLDYVAKHDEWRLLKLEQPANLPPFAHLRRLSSGTLVLWEQLDRLVDDTPASNRDAHHRFLDSIEEVRSTLSMIFHRFLEKTTSVRKIPLNIFINGREDQHALTGWNPFNIPGGPASKETPEEAIRHGKNRVIIRGFVLPHKDRLTEAQYNAGAGPKGWLSQQGYYIYRNDRIIVSGDWLKLGRSRPWANEEQFKLARLSIDIANTTDEEWGLDIKKSTATPPSGIREKLTGLAEAVRADARQVFAHRGEYGSRPQASDLIAVRPWTASQRSGRIVYLINREHPVIKSALQKIGPLEKDFRPVFRLIEEGVPVQKIWLDTAETPDEHSLPYEGFEDSVILEDIGVACDFLSQSLKSKDALKAFLSATEPFRRFPLLIERALKER